MVEIRGIKAERLKASSDRAGGQPVYFLHGRLHATRVVIGSDIIDTGGDIDRDIDINLFGGINRARRRSKLRCG